MAGRASNRIHGGKNSVNGATHEHPAARGSARPAHHVEASILSLQHTAGNGAVNMLLSGGDFTRHDRAGELPVGAGKPLDPATRADMEAAFGQEFGGVRVHADSRADEAARMVDASAYAAGRNLVFGAGQYDPHTFEGRRLLAHELAHVAQATRAGVREGMSTAGDASEREATRAGDTVARGGRAQALNTPTASIARQPKKPAVQVKTKTFDEVQKILEKTATGREALELKKKLKVTVKMSFGGIGYFPGPTNTIVLDMTETPVFLALAFVHEINHARLAHASKPSSERAKNMSKDDFVQSMLQEEAESDVKTYDAKYELQGTDVDLTGALPNPKDKLEEMYRTTIIDSAIKAQVADPKVTGAKMKEISQAAGKAAVIGRYQKGSEGEGHKKHYERQWEEANKGKVKGKQP
jgi:Domain of unknown function (DUF4157)